MLTFRIALYALLCGAGFAQLQNIEPIDLGSAGRFVILAKSGISSVPSSVITGNIGVSPIAATAITGFSLVEDATHPHFSTSAQVTGKVFAADYAVPTPSRMTTAVLDMETAYTAASSRSSLASSLNLYDGLISGKTFYKGVYTWDRDVTFASDIYLTGTSSDIFIFQTTGNMVAGSGAKIVLGGGLKSANIIWQIAGYLEANTGSHLEGIYLVLNAAVFKTGSSINGRILSQKAVTLDQVTVTRPRRPSPLQPLPSGTPPTAPQSPEPPSGAPEAPGLPPTAPQSPGPPSGAPEPPGLPPTALQSPEPPSGAPEPPGLPPTALQSPEPPSGAPEPPGLPPTAPGGA
jgi:hypothetical protein